MAKKITLLKGNLCIHKCFIDVLYIFSSVLKKNYEIKCAPIWDGFCVELCHVLRRFYLRTWTDPQCYATCFKELTFWILNKNFQEAASLSNVFSLFIHKISSKLDRDTSASKLNLTLMLVSINTLHASLLRRCPRTLYNFFFQIQFLDTFRIRS